jgi:hypothetical protein
MSKVNKLIQQAGKNISAKELKEIQQKTGYTPASIIQRAEKADVNVKPSAQDFVQQFATQQAQKQEQAAQAAANPGTQAVFSYSPAGAVSSVSYEPVSIDSTSQPSSSTTTTATTTSTDPLAGYQNYLDVQLAIQKGQLDNQRAIEQLRDAGMTERQKLVNENNLAVTGAEIKGKLDLQGIVNAGYKNIANIERGTNMFSSIMGAFNF